MKSSIDDLARVAKSLGDLNQEVVFLGGCVVNLLVPASVVPSVRVTEDVDCVVQAQSTSDYYRVSDRLRALGFKESTDDGAPICRWNVEDIVVDVMPTGKSALGFTNRWYDWVFVDPLELTIAEGQRVRIVNAPTFCATKFEAFADRGGGNFAGDSDFEDIVTILAHHEEIVAKILKSP